MTAISSAHLEQKDTRVSTQRHSTREENCRGVDQTEKTSTPYSLWRTGNSFYFGVPGKVKDTTKSMMMASSSLSLCYLIPGNWWLFDDWVWRWWWDGYGLKLKFNPDKVEMLRFSRRAELRLGSGYCWWDRVFPETTLDNLSSQYVSRTAFCHVESTCLTRSLEKTFLHSPTLNWCTGGI